VYQITKIVNFAKAHPDISAIYLFGSHAIGHPRSKSDPFLRHQIYKHGKFIYHDGSGFPFQFRASSIREYLDTNYLRTKKRANR
jgi:hypothetical protein